MTTPEPRLGLIAGGGALPLALARHCRAAGRPFFVIRLTGFADPGLDTFPGAASGLAQLGRTLALLRGADCRSVCFAGLVPRPDFAALEPDARGLAALPGALVAARQGDETLLSFLLSQFEAEGFSIEGAGEVMAGLTLPEGPLGRHAPADDHLADIELAMRIARAIGALDVGQGAVVCDGLALAVEAQEGTDAMLERVANLPAALRGSLEQRRGVLAKACKPIQDRRIDLPTLGPATVELAARAGLAGIAAEADRTLVVQRDDVASTADALGLFVVGVAGDSA